MQVKLLNCGLYLDNRIEWAEDAWLMLVILGRMPYMHTAKLVLKMDYFPISLNSDKKNANWYKNCVGDLVSTLFMTLENNDSWHFTITCL